MALRQFNLPFQKRNRQKKFRTYNILCSEPNIFFKKHQYKQLHVLDRLPEKIEWCNVLCVLLFQTSKQQKTIVLKKQFWAKFDDFFVIYGIKHQICDRQSITNYTKFTDPFLMQYE